MNEEVNNYFNNLKDGICIKFVSEVVFGYLEKKGLEPPYPIPESTLDTDVCSDAVVRGVGEAVRKLQRVVIIYPTGVECATDVVKRFHQNVLEDFSKYTKKSWDSLRVVLAFTSLLVALLVRERQTYTSITELTNILCEETGLFLRKNWWNTIQNLGGFRGILSHAQKEHAVERTICDPEFVSWLMDFHSKLGASISLMRKCIVYHYGMGSGETLQDQLAELTLH